MYHDFTGKELYKARHHDLMKEAEGGWRLKAAGAGGQGLSARKLALALLGALLVGLLLAQGLA
jgi:hypothetical protein